MFATRCISPGWEMLGSPLNEGDGRKRKSRHKTAFPLSMLLLFHTCVNIHGGFAYKMREWKKVVGFC